jgi:hypothetical protein
LAAMAKFSESMNLCGDPGAVHEGMRHNSIPECVWREGFVDEFVCPSRRTVPLRDADPQSNRKNQSR